MSMSEQERYSRFAHVGRNESKILWDQEASAGRRKGSRKESEICGTRRLGERRNRRRQVSHASRYPKRSGIFSFIFHNDDCLELRVFDDTSNILKNDDLQHPGILYDMLLGDLNSLLDGSPKIHNPSTSLMKVASNSQTQRWVGGIGKMTITLMVT
ncbi:hypothetical protein C8R42DRAFT_647400 [Lentinula raphanica]|nr:hypothetical protein C8R42DRAFT_647400 [Lentinula raphanica]